MKKVTDRRLFARTQENFTVEIYSENNGKSCIIAESRNVSKTGACLVVKKHHKADILARDNKIKVIFNVPFSKADYIPFRTISCHAIIKRLKEVGASTDKRLIIGIRFIDKLEIKTLGDNGF
ncbi:hypothetical protein ACFL1T_01105 [Chlamydiota bacterium]